MNKGLTLGSLFDGSGGFPLGGLLCGIIPLWASEIEPFPIRVTTKRLPQMKHYGDVSKLSGAELPPVNIITFGSPCQDMSLAGKRNGLNGSRSALFYDAIRIIKEMRCKTGGEYPKYIVWENVPGAFSSNGGEDFRTVLQEICKIKDEQLSVPGCKKWNSAGEILGDDFSIAWRLLDAQFWGVPQRRKRIYLVADLTGGSAGKILFESEGLSGYSSQSLRTWQRTARDTAKGFGETGRLCLNDQGGDIMRITYDITATLRAESHHPPIVFENHSQDTRYTQLDEVAPTVASTYGTGGNNQPFVVETPKTLKVRCGCDGGGKGALIQDNMSATISCNNDQTLFVPKAYGICSKDSNSMKSANPHSGIYETDTSRTIDGNGGNPSCNQGGIAVVCVDQGAGKSACSVSKDISPTLACTHGGEPAVCIQGSMIGREEKNGPQGSGVNEEVSFTLNATDRHAVAFAQDSETLVYSTSKNSHHTDAETELANTLVATDYKDPPLINDKDGEEYIVRRLTPTECARLQGFPDWWCSYLGTEEPTSEDIAFWRDVFETHRKITGTSKKPKTEKQIIKWLKEPHSDSAEYKMWGNGVALPNVCFVLAGIVWVTSCEEV